MTIEKTVKVKFTDKELIKFIGDRVIELQDDEDWELVSSYSTLNDYTFKIVKNEKPTKTKSPTYGELLGADII